MIDRSLQKENNNKKHIEHKIKQDHEELRRDTFAGKATLTKLSFVSLVIGGLLLSTDYSPFNTDSFPRC